MRVFKLFAVPEGAPRLRVGVGELDEVSAHRAPDILLSYFNSEFNREKRLRLERAPAHRDGVANPFRGVLPAIRLGFVLLQRFQLKWAERSCAFECDCFHCEM